MSSTTIESIDNLSSSKLVQLYLMASFLYYEHNISPLLDSEYDEVCKQLILKFHEIDHQHGYLIEKDALRAGTAYHLSSADYPTLVQIAAFAWREKGCPVVRGFKAKRCRRIKT